MTLRTLCSVKEASHTKILWFHLYEVPRAVKVIETERRLVVPRGGGRGMGCQCLVVTELQLGTMKGSGDRRMDGTEDCTTM